VRGPRAGAAFALVALASLGLAGGCSRTDTEAAKPNRVKVMGERLLPATAAPPAEESPEGTPKEPPAEHVQAATVEAGPVYYTVTTKQEAGTTGPDPDLAVLAAARMSGVSCFTGIREGAGTRYATVTVTVLPSGSVSRAEASSGDTQEDWVLSCLEGVGNGLHFSDKPKADIRTFSFVVSVTRAH